MSTTEPEDHGPDVIACDDGRHFIDLRPHSSHHGWVLRRHPDGFLVSVRVATHDEHVAAVWRRIAARVIEPAPPHERFA